MAGEVVNSNILPRINFCGVLTVLCSEIRHFAKRQTVSGHCRTTQRKQNFEILKAIK